MSVLSNDVIEMLEETTHAVLGSAVPLWHTQKIALSNEFESAPARARGLPLVALGEKAGTGRGAIARLRYH
jgi:hypothetical protein